MTTTNSHNAKGAGKGTSSRLPEPESYQPARLPFAERQSLAGDLSEGGLLDAGKRNDQGQDITKFGIRMVLILPAA